MTILSDLQRNCLYLRVEGFRYREIAEIVGVTISGIAGNTYAKLGSIPGKPVSDEKTYFGSTRPT